MGYSCTFDADESMRKIQGMFESKSNYWTGDDGKSYFFEIGRERKDGTITGTIFGSNGENTQCRKSGSIRIEPNGYVTRFAHLPKKIQTEVAKINFMRSD